MSVNTDYYQLADTPYLKEHEIEEWCQDNKYIKDYYRKTNQSYSYYFKSLFRFHNETINIWTHLLGFIGVLASNVYLNSTYDISLYVSRTVCFNIFTSCMMLCYIFSTIMHLLYPKSEDVCNNTQFLDYTGINLLIASTFATFVYFAFYCDTSVQTVYYTVILSFSLIVFPISRMKIFMKRKFRWIRPCVFVLYASSFIVPIIHRIRVKEKNDKIYYIELEYFIISAIMYIIGILFYISRYPEKAFHGKFDRIGSSHQLFHIFVLLGGCSSIVGTMKALYGDNNIVC